MQPGGRQTPGYRTLLGDGLDRLAQSGSPSVRISLWSTRGSDLARGPVAGKVAQPPLTNR
jgi:hypothetical protein